MDIHVHIHHEHDEQLNARLDRLQRSIHSLGGLIINQGEIMGVEFDALVVQVGRNTTVGGSILAIVSAFEAAKTDPAEIQKLADSLRANNDAVEAAVLRNTPVAPDAPRVTP